MPSRRKWFERLTTREPVAEPVDAEGEDV